MRIYKKPGPWKSGFHSSIIFILIDQLQQRQTSIHQISASRKERKKNSVFALNPAARSHYLVNMRLLALISLMAAIASVSALPLYDDVSLDSEGVYLAQAEPRNERTERPMYKFHHDPETQRWNQQQNERSRKFREERQQDQSIQRQIRSCPILPNGVSCL